MALTVPFFITCPACQTRYAVTAAAIGEGRTVKCTNCSNRWFQKAEDLRAQAAPPPPVETAAPKKVMAAKKKIVGTPVGLKIATIAAAVCVILGTLLVGESTLSRIGLQGLYHAVGIRHSTGLQLAKLNFKVQPRKSETRVNIQGVIVNQGETPQAVPVLRVTLLDENNIPIQYTDYNQDGFTIEPGESLPFTLDVASRSKRVEFVQVDLGTGWELALRE
jgi:predicted Zn finger-like uncharacterized protein